MGGDHMVTRRTRNFKEKKTVTSFGQFVLPLTVIMAVALLFFSVRLFFFGSGGKSDYRAIESETHSASQQLEESSHSLSATISDGALEEEKIDIAAAQPVKSAKEEDQKVKAVPKTAPAKAASMPAAGGTAKKEAVKATTTDGPRWDVQIGAFTSKENASALAEKTKSQGLGSYIVTEQKSGAPLYKVRVKNPNKTRGEAAALAKRLEADGHPVFLVETK